MEDEKGGKNNLTTKVTILKLSYNTTINTKCKLKKWHPEEKEKGDENFRVPGGLSIFVSEVDNIHIITLFVRNVNKVLDKYFQFDIIGIKQRRSKWK